MEDFDVIVVGSGSGLIVASRAAEKNLRVAQVEDDALGGTCLNWGCIPSKAIIYPADIITLIQAAPEFGIQAKVGRTDFGAIMDHMRGIVTSGRRHIEKAFRETDNPKLFRGEARFVGDKVLEVGHAKLRAETIVLANGASNQVPPVEGLKEVGYLDNHSVFGLKARPESLGIIGGGFIAAEMAHFFAAMGTQVTILGRNSKFLPKEEPEIAERVAKVLGRRCRIVTGVQVEGVRRRGKRKVIAAKRGGKGMEVAVDEVLLATGMRPNTKGMALEKTGVKVNDKGGIVVNEFLQTTREGIWALGDILGKHMFKHVANYEASLVAYNAFATEDEGRVPVDYHAVPYAIFTDPPVASVGMREAEVEEAGVDHLVGWADFTSVAKGEMMKAESGCVKAIVEKGTDRILGCHIMGPEAPLLIQEVITAMNAGEGDYHPILRAMHIHPALSEVVISAFGNLQDPHAARAKREPPAGIEVPPTPG